MNGYTESAVNRALRGLDQQPTIRVRGELFDQNDTKLYDLSDDSIIGGSVTHNTDQPIKRGADIKMAEVPRDSQHPAPLGTFAATVLAFAGLFHLRLNEASGNFADYTGNGRTFTTNGTITYRVGSLVLGDLTDTAIKLNGSTGYLSIADAAWMDIGTGSWYLAWQGTGTSQTLIDRDDNSSNRFFRFEVDSDGFLAFSINFTTGSPQYKTFTSAAIVNDGQPHLFHATYNKVDVKLFVDGKEVLSTPETRTMSTGTLAINIGRTVGNTNFSSGIFDEVGMVGRAMTAREIRDHYQTWSAQTNELLLDKDRGDRIRLWYGILMPSVGTDGTYWAEWPIYHGLLTTPLREMQEDETVELSVSSQDVSRILADYKLQMTITLTAGSNFITNTTAGVLAIAQLAGMNTSGWAVTASTLTALSDISFDADSSALDDINYLLLAINYKPIRFSGLGTGIIEPNKLDIDIPVSDTLITDAQSVVLTNVSEQIEARKVPNKVTVATANPDAGEIIAVVVNSNAGSRSSQLYLPPNSIAFIIDPPDQTTADAVAAQLLNDATARSARRVNEDTYPRPFHDDRDKLTLVTSQMSISGDFIEEEWVLPLAPQPMKHSFLSMVDVT